MCVFCAKTLREEVKPDTHDLAGLRGCLRREEQWALAPSFLYTNVPPEMLFAVMNVRAIVLHA